MKTTKAYEADDKMIAIIGDDYSFLQMLGAFGIKMGFGDKTVGEVCTAQQVDTFTFLAVVNYTVNGYIADSIIERLSLATLLRYIRASHTYYLDFELPHIRTALLDALDTSDNLAKLIVRLYDNLAQSIRGHMLYEEKTLFPYVEALLAGDLPANKMVETFSKHHAQTDLRLRELKNIIIRYMPAESQSNHRLMSALYDIYKTERWLHQHIDVEEDIFVPAIRCREEQCKQSNVSQRISSMIGSNDRETLSEREKDVVVCVVEGMSNKEIAEHLFIALNTVITHRRNIAKKLQIHTPAGLTIYAIVNGLVDISSVKL
ncbi:MAG: LuxR C-terminal-related transcriptional regulator [Prevotella sp.]|nr:LuxR C-terminal-related transcriptional regulator [Prevotella sp.]